MKTPNRNAIVSLYLNLSILRKERNVELNRNKKILSFWSCCCLLNFVRNKYYTISCYFEVTNVCSQIIARSTFHQKVQLWPTPVLQIWCSRSWAINHIQAAETNIILISTKYKATIVSDRVPTFFSIWNSLIFPWLFQNFLPFFQTHLKNN